MMPRHFHIHKWMPIPPGLLAVVLMVTLGGCAGSQRPILYAAPSLLPHMTPAMNTPGFWISRHPNPDAVILSDERIRRLNAHIRDDLKLTHDLSNWPVSAAGASLRETLQNQLKDLQDRDLLFLNGTRPSSEYWTSMRQAVNLETIPETMVRQYGFIVQYADQRLLPNDEGLYAKAHDVDFDELQNSALDIGTPVVIRHRSFDGRWLWVESSTSAGWVQAEKVATASEEQVNHFWSAPFFVVTSPKADLYLNYEMTDFYGSVLMGVRLPRRQRHDSSMEVLVPQRQSDGTATLVPAFVAADQVHDGYLPYTPRQVLQQAFKMNNQPYGWGGMYSAQDCSRFLQEVFATFGLELPRNSKDQIQTGTTLAAWPEGTPATEKLRLLREKGIGGVTILGMKGHIMLYLGSIDDRAYAIHAVWAYRQPGVNKDDIFVLNRVAASDLSLGERSKRGSLLDRLNAVRMFE